MPEYVYVILFVILVTVLISLWVSKKKKEVWSGTLVKKEWDPGDEDSSSSYVLVFETEDGKKKKFRTPDQRYYDQWEVGDRAEKKEGDFFPSKA